MSSKVAFEAEVWRWKNIQGFEGKVDGGKTAWEVIGRGLRLAPGDRRRVRITVEPIGGEPVKGGE